MKKQQWDYRKFNYRFYHITVNEVTWFLFKDRDQYFFTDKEPERGEPVDLPKGYEVKIDKKKHVPILLKMKSIDQSIDEFFANEKNNKETNLKSRSKKRRKMPSEMHDRYHRWNY